MYVKWIVCEIKKDYEKDFSLAQEQWICTKNATGFIGQVGGWDSENKKTACIISFWENEKSLKLFMKNIHDKIFFMNKQSEYYSSISVDHYNSLLKLKSKSFSLIDALKDAKFLSIEAVKVKQEKNEHFKRLQKNIWFPEMKKVRGNLGAYFSEEVDDSSRHLISTFWDSIGNLNNYLRQKQPELKVNSHINKYMEQITMRQIQLVDSWKIIKKATTNG